VPRWIGALLAVLGSRSSEEVNYDYFENKSIPPLAILVSGGRLAEGCVDTLKAYIEENIKGKKNFHRILLLEAEEAGNTSEAALPKISIQPLTEAQYKEELFTRYDERNASKIGQTFRLPPILRGETPATLNRATAVAAIRFAEEQVFEPERSDFDFLINSKILPELDVAFWNFVSNSPVTRDPEIMTTMVTALVSANVLTPNEGRLLASDIFNRSFTPFSGDWANQPIGMGGGLGMPFSEPASEEKAIEEGGAVSVETK
jgi:capsid portal protein